MPTAAVIQAEAAPVPVAWKPFLPVAAAEEPLSREPTLPFAAQWKRRSIAPGCAKAAWPQAPAPADPIAG
jgi:hypothetical protein